MSRGKKLDYLGMKLDYTKKGKVSLSIYEYIDKMLTEPPSDMNGMSRILAVGRLLNINPGATKLPEDRAQLFHHLVAKLLYLCRTIKTVKSDAIHQGYKIPYINHRTKCRPKMVGG